MKKTVKKEEEKREFTLEEAFVLWRNESKGNTPYLSGHTSEKLGSVKLVGFFNTNKKNPKEPDVRVCSVNEEGKAGNEIASLWETISPRDKRYLSGLTDENEKIIGFYGDENQEKRPYIRVYFKED